MNKTLFIRNIQTSYKLLLIFLAIVFMYTSVIIYMYDPKLATMLEQFQQALPEMMNAVGMSGIAHSLLEWMEIYLYGFIMLLFPLIFIIILVYKFIMKDIDRGSLASLLATHVSRKQFITTQYISLILLLTTFMCCISAIAIITSSMYFPQQLDLQKYFLLNFATLCLWLCIATYCFLIACYVNDSKYYFLFSIAVPLIMFLSFMLGNMNQDFSFLSYLSIFYYLHSNDIVTLGILPSSIYVMILLVISCSTVGIHHFCKRDLFL